MADRQQQKSFIHRSSGLGFVVTSIACMGFGYFVLGKLASYASNSRNSESIDPESLPAIVTLAMEHRWMYIILGLVPLVSGLLLALNTKPRSVWYILGLVGVLTLFGLLLLSVIALIAPMYQYQDL